MENLLHFVPLQFVRTQEVSWVSSSWQPWKSVRHEQTIRFRDRYHSQSIKYCQHTCLVKALSYLCHSLSVWSSGKRIWRGSLYLFILPGSTMFEEGWLWGLCLFLIERCFFLELVVPRVFTFGAVIPCTFVIKAVKHVTICVKDHLVFIHMCVYNELLRWWCCRPELDVGTICVSVYNSYKAVWIVSLVQ